MKLFSDEEIKEALIKVRPGLLKYCLIQEKFLLVDVRKDLFFQKKFNGFYRVRRGQVWRKIFYSLMENQKKKGLSFEKALKKVSKETGRLEASFVSKLIATSDPGKPVIDRFVLHHFNLRLPRPNVKNREKMIAEVYDILCQRYEDVLKSNLGRKICRMFDINYSAHKNISNLKKIDLVLWQIR